MSEFKEKANVEDETLQAVSGGASSRRSCKCTLCDQTFNMGTTADVLIIAHLNNVHGLSHEEIIKELNAINNNYVN